MAQRHMYSGTGSTNQGDTIIVCIIIKHTMEKKQYFQFFLHLIITNLNWIGDFFRTEVELFLRKSNFICHK